MLRLAIIALALAVVAGLFGFGIVASAFASIAQILFWVFVVVFVVGLVMGLIRGRGAV